MILKRTYLVVVSFCFLLVKFQCNGMNYVRMDRSGKTSQQLANELHRNLLNASNPREVGQIIAAEIANNDVSCQIGPQATLLSQHLREHGHWNDVYALNAFRGNHAPKSRYATTVANLNVVELDTIVADLLKLLLSGKVSFCIGETQGPVPPRDEYSFVLYANITGHGIANLAAISGRHNGSGSNYLRIVFRFMDRLRAELNSLGLQNKQLNIITMFHENPRSNGLARAVLPAGIDPASGLVPLGRSIGHLPGGMAPDNRVPPVAQIYQWYHVFAFWNWFR